ncbi:MAG: glycoside hydrolase family 2 protein, partial [Oscillospiraceae bacterium]|nr:glycoside hydrolase family 2 protein [Oscillospiraceae bacterium]
MKIQSLDGVWKLTKKNDPGTAIRAEVPGSVYTALLGARMMNDPYFREEQYNAKRLCEEDYVYSRDFTLNQDIAACGKLILRFEGIDTLADIYLNGSLLGKCDNMHRIWEYNAAPLLTGNTEHIEVRLHSPAEYVRRMN